MRAAGRVVAEMHSVIRAAIEPGVTTAQLDRLAREVLARRNADSNFLGYHGYPAVICASVNDVVVHGIPSRRRLRSGDILSIDCGAIVDGWHADAAFTVGVGELAPGDARLIEAAEAALRAAIRAMTVGNHVADIGRAVESTASHRGFGVLRDYCGHGIGTAMHESPDVPNHAPRRAKGPVLRAGMVLAVEPMLVAGEEDVEVDDDGWAVRTVDGRRAAHTEHTIVVTDHGPEILTR